MILQNCEARFQSVQHSSTHCVWWFILEIVHLGHICILKIRLHLDGLQNRSYPFLSLSSVWRVWYHVEDEVLSDCWSLMLSDDSLFEPPNWFPTLEFDQYFVGDDILEEVEVDLALDCVSCKIEGFINLNKSSSHFI